MAAGIKFQGPPRGRYAAGISDLQKPLAKAITGAFREGAKLIQAQGRAAISASGLGARFARQFRVFAFPRRQFSLEPRIKGWHARGWKGSPLGFYANIFARGGTIHGKPLLWIPLPTAPAKIAGQRTTPALYVANIGPLHSIRRAGGRPLLAGESLRPVLGRRATVAQLRTGARNAQARRAGGRGRRVVAVPMFVGVSSVRIDKRVDIDGIFKRTEQLLPRLFEERLRAGAA